MASIPTRVTAMGGGKSPRKYHAEYPTRQRRRLMIGKTNMLKRKSVGDVKDLSNQKPDVAKATYALSETNLAAIKPTVYSPPRQSLARYQANESGKVVPSIEVRRLNILSPTNASTSTNTWKDISLSDGIPRPYQSSGRSNPAPPTEALQSETKRNYVHGVAFGISPRIDLPSKNRMGDNNKEKFLLAHNRAQLYNIFLEKYGSMRAVFRAFDKEGNGMISAQRFRDMIEASEVDFSPSETNALFKSADVNGDNAVAYQEFAQMFSTAAVEPTIGASSSFSPSGEQDPSSSMAIKYRRPLELSPRSQRRMKQLRKQVTQELHRKCGLAIDVRGGKPEQLLTYAFKNVDADNDGFLSYLEVEHALGRGYLNLEDTISASDMREMVQLIDRNHDERISIREFVRYFGVGERDVHKFINARQKELAALNVKRKTELTPREEIDPSFACRKSGMLCEKKCHVNLDNSETTFQACLQEQLCERTAAIINADNGVKYLTQGEIADCSRETKTSKTLSNSLLPAEIIRRPTSSGYHTIAVPPLVSQDRFYHRRHERTDWSRVGVGGNGISSGTGLFQSPQERFITTNSEAYSPFCRMPLPVGTNESLLLARTGKSITTIEEETRRTRRAKRYERTQDILRRYENEHAQAELLKDWKVRAKIREVANERFCYLDKLQERENFVAAREHCIRRRYGGIRSLRMWAGSGESQFNS